MADPSLQQLAADPDFIKLPLVEKTKVLAHYYSDYSSLPRMEQMKVALRLNPDYVAQGKKGFFSPSKERGVDKSVGGVASYVGGQLGAGLWDAVKGTAQLVASPVNTAWKMGRSMWESLKQLPEVPSAIRDLVQNPKGGEAIALELPRAMGQYAGAELSGKVLANAPKIVKGGVEAGKFVKDVVSGEKSLQSGAQSYVAGAGPEAAIDMVEKVRGERANEIAKIQKKNADLKQKYDEDVTAAAYERRLAEKEHAEAVDKAAKEHAAKVLEEKQVYEKKVAARARLHDRRIAKVDHENAEKMKEYEEETKRIEAYNKEQTEAVGRRAELGTQLDQESAQLSDNLKSFASAAKAKEKSMYAPVDKATEGASIPASEAEELVDHAESDILQGSEENIKQFREIINRSEADTPELEEREEDPRGYAYKLGGEGTLPIAISDARGFATELGDALANRSGILGDVRRAIAYVREGLKAKYMKIYDDAGVGDQARAADAFHMQRMRTFYNPKAIKTRGGSPVTLAIRAPKDAPAYVRDPFINPDYGEMARKQIRAYESDPDLGAQAKLLSGQIEKIVKDEMERVGLPKKAKVKEAPTTPTLKEHPEAPEPIEPPKEKPFVAPELKLPTKAQPPAYPRYADDFSEPPTTEHLVEDLKAAKKKSVTAKSKQFSEMNKWDAIAAGYGFKEILTGEFPKAWAYIIAHYGVGKAMMIPKINAWLTEVTPTDVAILDKLYENNPAGKAEAQTAITEILSKGRVKPKLRALMNFLTKPQVRAIIQATSSVGAAAGAEGVRREGEKLPEEAPPSASDEDEE